MTSVDRINVNTQGIGSFKGSGNQAKPEDKKAEEKEATVIQQNPVAADEVLNFMAQSAVSVAPKTVDPSKYVDDASADRIAGFMADFEDEVAKGLAAFDAEFEGVDISDSAKMAAVLAQINQEM